jgi:hypothetical protein
MTTPNIQTPVSDDPFDSASNPVLPTYDLFGKVEISAWYCALVKGQGKVAYDPSAHDKRFTAIDIYIQPLPEIDVKYPKSLEDHPIAESKEWAGITFASLKALGVNNIREANGRFARVARVANGKQYEKKDAQGNKTGQFADETTFKFVAFFATEDACRAAYVAAGGAPSNGANGHNNPTPVAPDASDAERATALAFLKVIVSNSVRGLTDWTIAKDAVAKALAQYPTVAKFYTAESVETGQLMSEANDKLLPF